MSWERVIELVEALSPYPKGMYQPIDHPFFHDWTVTEPCWERLQTVMDYVGSVEGRRILDIGCNFGYFTHKMAQLGARAVGVDTEPSQVEVCRLLSACYGLPPGNPEFHHTSYQEYLAADGDFDLILFFNLLHHEMREDPDAAWRSLNLVSRRTDLLLISLCEENARMGVPDWRPELMLEYTDYTRCTPLGSSQRPRVIYALDRGSRGSPL